MTSSAAQRSGKYIGFRVAPRMLDKHVVIRVLVVYLASVIDTAIWTPIFTGAAVLWGWIVVTQWHQPMLLWIVVPVWLAMAIYPTMLALRFAYAIRSAR